MAFLAFNWHLIDILCFNAGNWIRFECIDFIYISNGFNIIDSCFKFRHKTYCLSCFLFFFQNQNEMCFMCIDSLFQLFFSWMIGIFVSIQFMVKLFIHYIKTAQKRKIKLKRFVALIHWSWNMNGNRRTFVSSGKILSNGEPTNSIKTFQKSVISWFQAFQCSYKIAIWCGGYNPLQKQNETLHNNRIEMFFIFFCNRNRIWMVFGMVLLAHCVHCFGHNFFFSFLSHFFLFFLLLNCSRYCWLLLILNVFSPCYFRVHSAIATNCRIST